MPADMQTAPEVIIPEASQSRGAFHASLLGQGAGLHDRHLDRSAKIDQNQQGDDNDKTIFRSGAFAGQHLARLGRRHVATVQLGQLHQPRNCLAKFEKETGIKVTVTDYDSNDAALAKIEAGGSGFDLVVPTHQYVQIYAEKGLIVPLGSDARFRTTRTSRRSGWM